MKNTSLLIVILTLCLSFNSNAQDKDLIFKNLTYINNQFKQYNKYHTLWAVDYAAKEIVCFDKFGSLRGKLNEVIIEAKNGSSTLLNFKCISGKCLKKIDNATPTRDSYSMGLSQNLNTVVRKFNEIFNQFGSNNSNTNFNNSNSKKYSFEVKKNVEQILERLTEIFQTENKYQHKWYVNWDKNHIYSKTKYCEVFIPLGKGVRIENADKGYRFLADSKIIREKCTSFDNYVVKSFNNLNTTGAAEEVIYLFDEILAMTK